MAVRGLSILDTQLNVRLFYSTEQHIDELNPHLQDLSAIAGHLVYRKTTPSTSTSDITATRLYTQKQNKKQPLYFEQLERQARTEDAVHKIANSPNRGGPSES